MFLFLPKTEMYYVFYLFLFDYYFDVFSFAKKREFDVCLIYFRLFWFCPNKRICLYERSIHNRAYCIYWQRHWRWNKRFFSLNHFYSFLHLLYVYFQVSFEFMLVKKIVTTFKDFPRKHAAAIVFGLLMLFSISILGNFDFSKQKKDAELSKNIERNTSVISM